MANYTVVSLLPFELNEHKPIDPSDFLIPAAGRDDIQILSLLDDGYTRRIYTLEGKSIIVPEPTKIVAEALCYDYITGSFGIGEGRRPGLFALEGLHSKEEIKRNYEKEIHTYRVMQNQWFQHIVRLADDDWKMYGSFKVVSNLHRIAADQLGLDRPWNVDIQDQEMIACPYCTQIIPKRALKCPKCQEIVNAVAYQKMKGTVEKAS